MAEGAGRDRGEGEDVCLEDCDCCVGSLAILENPARLIKVRKNQRVKLGRLLMELKGLWRKEEKLWKSGMGRQN